MTQIIAEVNLLSFIIICVLKHQNINLESKWNNLGYIDCQPKECHYICQMAIIVVLMFKNQYNKERDEIDI